VADGTQDPGAVQELEATVRAMAARMDEMAAELDVLRTERAGDRPPIDVGERGSTGDDVDLQRRSGPGSSVAGQPSSEGPTPSDGRMSRRGALALGAAAAVGLGAVADSVLSATPAWATTGNMQYGAGNNAGTAATDLTSTAASQTLSIENTGNGTALLVGGGVDCQPLSVNSSGQYTAISATLDVGANSSACIFGEVTGLGSAVVGSVLNSSNSAAAVYGFTRGLNNAVQGNLVNAGSQAAAVLGLTNGTGAGVEGTSTSGYGLSGQGGLAPLYLSPAGSAGPPTSGAHALGELYVDAGGVVYSCQSAGTPGTWVPVLVGGTTNALGATETTLTADIGQVALLVENTGTGSNATALVGSDGGTGTGGGVRGELDNAANPSAAVEGVTNGTGAALVGSCSGAGYGAALTGGLAPLWLEPSASAGAPTAGAHAAGELYVDVDAVQYRCVASGTPGTWVPQYSVVPLPAPVRVINTSTGEGGITGPLVPGSTVHSSAVLTNADGIPDGAVGVVANLAVSGVGGALLNGYGVMTIFPAGEATPATANINAGAGCFAESNTVTVAFGTGADAGKVSIVWNGGGPVPNAQAYLDVIAYLL
jgi:hypothetical protein